MTIVSYEPWALVSRFQRQFDRALAKDADAPAASATVELDPERGHP